VLGARGSGEGQGERRGGRRMKGGERKGREEKERGEEDLAGSREGKVLHGECKVQVFGDGFPLSGLQDH